MSRLVSPVWVPNIMFVVVIIGGLCGEGQVTRCARESSSFLTCHTEVPPWRASRPALRAGRRGKARALGRGELNQKVSFPRRVYYLANCTITTKPHLVRFLNQSVLCEPFRGLVTFSTR